MNFCFGSSGVVRINSDVNVLPLLVTSKIDRFLFGVKTN